MKDQTEQGRKEKQAQAFLKASEGGCSAMAWETEEGQKLWGRNFDFNRIAAGTKVLYVPKGTVYDTCGGAAEKQESVQLCGKYAAIGIGGRFLSETPLFYEGMNGEGLMGGQLYFREFAAYPKSVQPGRIPVQPSVLLTYVLLQCKDTSEVEEQLSRKLCLVDRPILGTVVQIHWMFTDKTGRSIVVESKEDGLHIYSDTMGIMTNSPDYAWHRLNLLNYANIRDLDYGTQWFEKECVKPCFSGSGALGLPGDWSSPSRFIRLAFLKKYGIRGKNEKDGVQRLFHTMHQVAFPPGMAVVGEPGESMGDEMGTVPYDYTLYTSVMCAQSGNFYWTTFHNMAIRQVALPALRDCMEPVEFVLES